MSNSSGSNKDLKLPISIFLAFHLTSIFWVAFMPLHLKYAVPPIAAYIHFFGLYQNWLMFEKPTTGNYYLLASIEKKDGTKYLVNFPHMDELSTLDAMKFHRFRKFQQSSVFNPRNEFILSDVATWFINGLKPDERSDVVSVTLVQKKTAVLGSESELTTFFVFRPEAKK